MSTEHSDGGRSERRVCGEQTSNLEDDHQISVVLGCDLIAHADPRELGVGVDTFGLLRRRLSETHLRQDR